MQYFIYLFNCNSIHSLHSFIHSFIHLFIYLFIYLFTYLFIYFSSNSLPAVSIGNRGGKEKRHYKGKIEKRKKHQGEYEYTGLS